MMACRNVVNMSGYARRVPKQGVKSRPSTQAVST